MIRVFIEAVSGPGQGNRIPIGQNQVLTVGRTEWSDVSIPNDPQISGKHFQVENTGAEVRLADLNSTNGTMVNGQFVKQAILGPGDQIVAGSTTFVVHIERSLVSGAESPTRAVGESLRVPNGGPSSGPAGTPTPSLHVPAPPALPFPATPLASPGAPAVPVSSTPFAAGSAGFQSPIFIPPNSSMVGHPPPVSAGAALPPVPPPAAPPPLSSPPLPAGAGQSPAAVSGSNSPVVGGQTPFATPIQFDDQQPLSPREAAPTMPRGSVPQAPPSSAAAARPAVVLDERRQAASHDGLSALSFRQTPLANGLVLYEGLAPADPAIPGATRVALVLSQVGPIELIVHFGKLGQPVPLEVSGKPLFHWWPEPAASQSGPLLLRPTTENAHLAWLDAAWGQDSVLAACGPDLEQLERHLLDLVQYNPLGFRRGNTLFGYCWPVPLLQLCRSGQADIAAALFGSAVHFYFGESDAVPGGWCLIGRAGLASTLQQLGFQEIPAAVPARK